MGTLSLSLACSSARPYPANGDKAKNDESSATPIFALPGAKAGAKKRVVSLKEAGIDGDAMDRTADVCKSLYSFACGKWVSSTVTAPGARIRKKDTAILAKVDDELHRYLEGLSPSSKVPEEVALRDFYRSCMDVQRIDELGIAPVTPYLQKLAKARTREDLAAFTGDIHPLFDAFFHFTPMESFLHEPQGIVAFASPGGFGALPRDAYLDTDAVSVARRADYVSHAKRLLVLAKFSEKEAALIISDAMKLQTALADASPIEGTTPRWTALEHGSKDAPTPGFPWATFLSHLGVPGKATVSVSDAGFVEKMGQLFGSASVAEIRHYLTWRVVADLTRETGGPIREERNAWAEKQGEKSVEEPRWSLCVKTTRDELGDLLASRTLDAEVTDEERAGARSLFDASIVAAGNRFDDLFWLDDASRSGAHAKLEGMKLDLERHQAPAPVGLRSDAFAENIFAIDLAWARRNFANVGAPASAPLLRAAPFSVVPTTWLSHNRVTMPPGLLHIDHPPAALPALWGSRGYETSHAIIEGFGGDNIKLGNVGQPDDWMTPATKARLAEKAQCMTQQLASTSMTVKTTAIDRGAVEVAFRAYRNARHDANEVTVADGLTEDQQFFLAYAQGQCEAYDASTALAYARSAEGMASTRVDLVAANVPEVAEAFGCKRQPHVCEMW